MEYLTDFAYEIVAVSVLLLLGYIATLWHTVRGSKFTMVLVLIGLLIVYNAVGLPFSLALYHIFGLQDHSNRWIWTLSLAQLVADLTWSVSHHILAMKYRRIATVMPLTIAGESVPETYERKENRLYWMLMAANVTFPLMDVGLIPFYTTLLAGEPVSENVNLLVTVA